MLVYRYSRSDAVGYYFIARTGIAGYRDWFLGRIQEDTRLFCLIVVASVGYLTRNQDAESS